MSEPTEKTFQLTRRKLNTLGHTGLDSFAYRRDDNHSRGPLADHKEAEPRIRS